MIGKQGKGKVLGNRQGNKKSFRASAGGKEKDLRGPISRIKPSPRYPSDLILKKEQKPRQLENFLPLLPRLSALLFAAGSL